MDGLLSFFFFPFIHSGIRMPVTPTHLYVDFNTDSNENIRALLCTNACLAVSPNCAGSLLLSI
uniref:Uncharacterized protein n=1 Tax=Amphilophus citrinellus TaxID=61819 RepID=A0A3Q0QVD9_AMPCI